MIDKNLLNKFNAIQELPLSEEMLGAYLEGNLNFYDTINVESVMWGNDNLFAFMDKSSMDESVVTDYLETEFLGLDNDFVLPEMQMGITMLPYSFPLRFEPSSEDVVNVIMPEVASDGDSLDLQFDDNVFDGRIDEISNGVDDYNDTSILLDDNCINSD